MEDGETFDGRTSRGRQAYFWSLGYIQSLDHATKQGLVGGGHVDVMDIEEMRRNIRRNQGETTVDADNELVFLINTKPDLSERDPVQWGRCWWFTCGDCGEWSISEWVMERWRFMGIYQTQAGREEGLEKENW